MAREPLLHILLKLYKKSKTQPRENCTKAERPQPTEQTGRKEKGDQKTILFEKVQDTKKNGAHVWV
jgi:hypothetical protein